MIKLALVTGDSSLSGAPMHVYRLALGLKKRGFKILIIAPPGPLERCCQEGRLPFKPIYMRGVFDVNATRAIHNELQLFRPDIIHFHGTRGGWLGRLAARNMVKPKKVYTEHLFTKTFRLPNATYDRVQRMGLRFLERWTDKMIAVSNAVKDFMLAQGFKKSKIVVIPHGVNPLFFDYEALYKPKGLPVLIGSVGSLNENKNYKTALTAFAKVRKMLPKENIHYEIIGDGPLDGKLKKLAAQKKLGEHVHFKKTVPADEVAQRLEHYTIFLNVSLSESFGLAVGEAMAVGVPVVVSNIEALRELVCDKCGFKVDPRNVDKIAKAMVKLIKHQKLRRQMGLHAKSLIKKNYSEKRMIERTIKVYNELLNR